MLLFFLIKFRFLKIILRNLINLICCVLLTLRYHEENHTSDICIIGNKP